MLVIRNRPKANWLMPKRKSGVTVPPSFALLEVACFSAPEGRQSVARGASPWERRHHTRKPRRGERTGARFASLSPLRGLRTGLARTDQGLAPLAIDCRPFGAEKRAVSIFALAAQKRSILGLVWRSLLIACLLASMLFAHGCHGNKDNELFGAAAERIVLVK